jgi:hypothetical protein
MNNFEMTQGEISSLIKVDRRTVQVSCDAIIQMLDEKAKEI